MICNIDPSNLISDISCDSKSVVRHSFQNVVNLQPTGLVISESLRRKNISGKRRCDDRMTLVHVCTWVRVYGMCLSLCVSLCLLCTCVRNVFVFVCLCQCVFLCVCYKKQPNITIYLIYSHKSQLAERCGHAMWRGGFVWNEPLQGSVTCWLRRCLCPSWQWKP